MDNPFKPKTSDYEEYCKITLNPSSLFARWKKAEDIYLDRLMLKLVKNTYENGGLDHNKMFGPIKEQLQRVKEIKSRRHNNLFIYLTISPPEPYGILELHKFMNKLDKFVKKKTFKDYMYVMEQRDKAVYPDPHDGNYGNGFHAHILLVRNLNYPPNKVYKRSLDTWKGMFPSKLLKNPKLLRNVFHWNWMPEEFLGDKIKYMTEEKDDDDDDVEAEKYAKQVADTIWREEYNIPKIFGDPENLYKYIIPQGPKGKTKSSLSIE